MSSPSSPSRREFFKRAGTAVAAVAVVATPLSLLAQKPSPTSKTIHITGDNLRIQNSVIEGNVVISGSNNALIGNIINNPTTSHAIVIRGA